MLSIAVVGYSKSEGMKKNSDILESLKLGPLTLLIIVAAGATVFTSFLGLVGAYFKNMLTLKLVRSTPTRSQRSPCTLTSMPFFVAVPHICGFVSLLSCVCVCSTWCWC